MVFSNLESRKKKVKRKAILLLAYIADVSCITNRSFYMRTLSLRISLGLLLLCQWKRWRDKTNALGFLFVFKDFPRVNIVMSMKEMKRQDKCVGFSICLVTVDNAWDILAAYVNTELKTETFYFFRLNSVICRFDSLMDSWHSWVKIELIPPGIW